MLEYQLVEKKGKVAKRAVFRYYDFLEWTHYYVLYPCYSFVGLLYYRYTDHILLWENMSSIILEKKESTS